MCLPFLAVTLKEISVVSLCTRTDFSNYSDFVLCGGGAFCSADSDLSQASILLYATSIHQRLLIAPRMQCIALH